MALFLRDEEVNQSVTMEDMLEAIEEMQRRFGQGEVTNLARRKIIAPGGMLSVMGGGLFYDGILGVKTYTVVQGKYSFQVSVYDANTGELMCYTQANRLGQLRTGATTGVAVKHPGATPLWNYPPERRRYRWNYPGVPAQALSWKRCAKYEMSRKSAPSAGLGKGGNPSPKP